ncbi:hypothetical protein BJI61_08205 [Acinetobacter baumannii]|nr:hypothetical protein BJI61_08205 [Acinetobacter baumannii]
MTTFKIYKINRSDHKIEGRIFRKFHSNFMIFLIFFNATLSKSNFLTILYKSKITINFNKVIVFANS